MMNLPTTQKSLLAFSVTEESRENVSVIFHFCLHVGDDFWYIPVLNLRES